MIEKERGDDLQSFWDLIQGSTDQAQRSTHCACRCGPCRQTVCPPTSSMHNTDTSHTMVTRWPQEGGGWETLSAPSAQTGEGQRRRLLGVLPLPRSVHSNAAGLSRGEVRAGDLTQHPPRRRVGLQSGSDYKAEEEPARHTWLKRSCTLPEPHVPRNWGGPPRSSFRPGLAPVSASPGPGNKAERRKLEQRHGQPTASLTDGHASRG